MATTVHYKATCSSRCLLKHVTCSHVGMCGYARGGSGNKLRAVGFVYPALYLPCYLCPIAIQQLPERPGRTAAPRRQGRGGGRAQEGPGDPGGAQGCPPWPQRKST